MLGLTRGAAGAADDLTALGRGIKGKFAKAIHVPEAAAVDNVFDASTGRLKVLQDKCFAPETLIATPAGPPAIGEIRRGEVVLAYDHRTGQWTEREVAVFHESIYEGPLVTVTTDAGNLSHDSVTRASTGSTAAPCAAPFDNSGSFPDDLDWFSSSVVPT